MRDGLLFPLSPLWSDAHKYLEVDARHWARKYREVLLVEEVVDCTLQREVGPLEYQHLLERDVRHKVWRKLARECAIVRGHRVSLGVVAPLIDE